MPRRIFHRWASTGSTIFRQPSPVEWFWLALLVLVPVQIYGTSSDPWFWQPPKPVGDGCDYENLAYHVAQGRGFVFDNRDPAWRQIYLERPGVYAAQLQATPRELIATGRPPLFPLVISAIYQVLGRNAYAFAAVRLFLASCLAISGGLAVFVAAKLLSNSFASWIANLGCLATLGFAASNRTLTSYATDFLTEPLALLLTELFVVCTLAMCRTQGELVSVPSRDRHVLRQRDTLPAVAGIILGGMILTRSMFVLWLPPIWLLGIVSTSGSRVQRLRSATLVILVACLVCLPWWGRNVAVLQRWMPLGTQGPITLLGGYSDSALQANGDWQFAPELALREELSNRPDFLAVSSDTQREVMVADVARQRVKKWIADHRDELPSLAAKRVYEHWNPYTGRSLIWKCAIVLGAFMLLVRREQSAWWLLGLPLVSTVVVAALYSVGGRFLVPLYGVLFTLGGLGLAWTAKSVCRAVSQ